MAKKKVKKEEKPNPGKRLPRGETSCVECGEKAEVERNGDWRCLATHQIPGEFLGMKNDEPMFNTIRVLTCGARGVTLKDGYMATLRGSFKGVE